MASAFRGVWERALRTVLGESGRDVSATVIMAEELV